jgi:endonuclease/exonuclease/phosphatase family metal-dependent hydrolase
MQRLLDAGLTDLGAAVEERHAVPTAVNADKMHAARMRLDYMLANAALAPAAGPARPLHTADTDRLSGHYPIECVLRTPAG